MRRLSNGSVSLAIGMFDHASDRARPGTSTRLALTLPIDEPHTIPAVRVESSMHDWILRRLFLVMDSRILHSAFEGGDCHPESIGGFFDRLANAPNEAICQNGSKKRRAAGGKRSERSHRAARRRPGTAQTKPVLPEWQSIGRSTTRKSRRMSDTIGSLPRAKNRANEPTEVRPPVETRRNEANLRPDLHEMSGSIYAEGIRFASAGADRSTVAGTGRFEGKNPIRRIGRRGFGEGRFFGRSGDLGALDKVVSII